MFFKLADNRNEASVASHFRRQRIRKFTELIGGIARPSRVLDVGGTAEFWERYRSELPAQISVTVLNRNFEMQPQLPWIEYVVGDARRMGIFGDREFDMCFSNSVIEHVGSFEDQASMAAEICRISRGYFVQTPNAHFPIEPHFLVPMWQFAPIALRAKMLQSRDWGWMKRTADPALARATVESIRLLTMADLYRLFPDAQIYREKIGFLTKSIAAWRPVC